MRVTGVTQLVLGLLFWTDRALMLLPVHMLVGMTFVIALWILAGVAGWAGLRWWGVLFSVAWGLLVPVFGIMQMQLLPGPRHWVVEVTHLLIGLLAMMIGDRLAHFIQHRPRGGQRGRVPAAVSLSERDPDAMGWRTR